MGFAKNSVFIILVSTPTACVTSCLFCIELVKSTLLYNNE